MMSKSEHPILRQLENQRTSPGRVSRVLALGIGLGFALLGATFPSAASADSDGYLYGRITTEDGDTYQGQLRWGDEEAFWGDFFNSSKEDLPGFDYIPRRSRRDKERIKVLGVTVGWDEHSSGRQFACRFGDIEKIEVLGNEDAVLTMRSGTEFEVSGGANDVEGKINVWDESIGKIGIRWNRIDTIEFMNTPSSLRPRGGYRLHGTVETDAGDFTGFIQWDSEECLSEDELDGDSRDGRLSIEMGQIRSIERRGGRSDVTLKDGRELRLDGTNDVDSSIRGILVEDERYGRVEVTWDAFHIARFDDEGGSGPSRSEFGPWKRLEATVTDIDGEAYSGEIYFDLDESESWELLNGEFSGVEYNIPFELVSSIEPRSRSSAKIELRSGEKLRLGDGQDVSEKNDGLVVFVNADDDDPVYVDWRDIDRIEFHW